MRAKTPVVSNPSTDQGPVGLGGWLILPILGLIVTVLAVLARTLTSTIPDLRNGVWHVLTNPGSVYYHPAWAPILSFEYITDVLILVGSVILLVLLLQKKPIVPRLMVGFYGFCFLAIVIDSVVVLLLGPQMMPDAGVREEIGWTAGRLTGDVARAALAYAIWAPYFLMSKRVKNTFVRRPTQYFVAPPPSGQWVYPDYPRQGSYPAPPDSQGPTSPNLPV